MISGCSSRLAVLLATTALGLGLGGGVSRPAWSQAVAEARHEFNISGRSVRQALNEIGRVSGITILFGETTGAGGGAAPVRGAMTVSQAVSAALTGSGLSWHFTNANTVTIFSPSAASPVDDGAIMLEPIVLAGGREAISGAGFQGTPDWVYRTPAAVSVVTQGAIKARPPRNTADVIRDTSGVWVENDRRNAGTTVNIRGLASNGRVVMTLDDARQNFRTIAGAQGLTDTAFIDPAFLRGVEIEKTRATGVGGAGALSGVANFRTLNPDDLLASGKPVGFMLDTTTGSNAYTHSVNGAVAWRVSPDLSVMLGFGDKKVGNYTPGQSGLADLTALAGAAHIGFNANYDISKMTAQDQSTALFKAVWRPNAASELKFSVNGYRSAFEWSTAAEADGFHSEKSIDSRTYALDYAYKPGNPLIDLSAKLYLSRTDSDSYYPYRPATNYCPCTSATELATLGGFVRNTSEFSLGATEITAHYGFEFLRDSTSGQSHESTGRDNDQRWFNQESPDADRLLASAFVDLSIRPNAWLDIRPGLRYDHFSLKGTGQRLYFPDGPMGLYMPSWGDFSVDRSEGKLSPSLTLAVTPREGLQFYGKYVEGFRPPQIQEAMFSGLHIGATSSLIGVWRFFPNTTLRPETSRTYDLGANASFDNLLRDGDSLRLKASVFHSRVENYTTIAYVALPNHIGSFNSIGGAFVNTLDPATFKGTELEVAYDAGRYFGGLSYTYLDSNLNTANFDPYIYGGAVAGGANAFTDEVFSIAVPPRHKASLDLGGRFFDDRLTLGTRIHYASASKHRGSASQSAMTLVPAHTTVDLYGAWKITDLATASFSITNVSDKAHGDPLATGLVLAPGRTATVSLNMRF